MYKNIYDDPETIEVKFQVSDSNIFRLPLGRMFTTYEVWTGTGKTGTQLVDGTDFYPAGESARATAFKGESVYTGLVVSNASYHSTDLYITILWVGTLGNTDTIYRDVGELKRFPTYKDRTASRLLPFAFDNAVAKADYPDLYAEVGDVFEAMHVAAGDSASASDEFYPTPIPGYYERTGLPDIEFSDSDVGTNIISKTINYPFRNGTRVKFELVGSGSVPSGLSDGGLYYVNYNSGAFRLYNDEANAIAQSVNVTFSGGSGTFRLTQEGVEIGDAFQGFELKIFGGGAGTSEIDGRINLASSTGGVADVMTSAGAAATNRAKDFQSDGTNGTPRTSNETRPATLHEFGYIRY